MSGPPRRPLEIVRLEGNPGKRKLPASQGDVRDTSGIPTCPRWLDAEARAEWKRIIPLLDAMGLIGQTDRAAIAGYCVSYSRWLTAERIVTRKGLTMTVRTKAGGKYEQQRPEVSIAQKYLDKVKAFCAEYGMTASSRGRMSIPGKPARDDFSDLDS